MDALKAHHRNLAWIICGLFLMAAMYPVAVHAGSFAVRWVLDGDTIILQDNRHVRYLGINTPEVAHKDQPGEPFGPEARAYNQSLVKSRRVSLEFDHERRDRYGRVLAYVFTSDGKAINLALLESGLAWYLPQKYPLKQAAAFLAAQRRAMRMQKGFWPMIERQNDSGPCIGNRNSGRFHLPACPYGQKTRKANQVLFPRAWDAFYAGYAPCRKCYRLKRD